MKINEVRELVCKDDESFNKFKEFVREGDDWGTGKFELGGFEFELITCSPISRDGSFDIIFKVDEKFYRILATYNSWDANDYDEYSFTEVKEVETTTTDYEDIDE